jgi:transcriptional regulator with XRE-family HTH domain
MFASNETVARRLRYARIRANLPIKTLAERTGGRFSRADLMEYERGLRCMSVEDATIVATALGTVTPGYLLSPLDLDVLTMYRERRNERLTAGDPDLTGLSDTALIDHLTGVYRENDDIAVEEVAAELIRRVKARRAEFHGQRGLSTG